MSNEVLHAAKKAKADDFYTQLSDIEKELQHYREHFKGKVVLCNCDDPRVSSFFTYFSLNFHKLGLKKLITTCYKNDQPDLFSTQKTEEAIWLEYDGTENANGIPSPEEIGIHPLKGNGDFRSQECIEFLKHADIVVTNPPFSLFREYVSQLIQYEKKFLIVGNMNAVTYREIFPLVKENRIWLGCTGGSMEFRVPDDYPEKETRFWVDEEGKKWRSLGNSYWFTNLEHRKRNEEIFLYKKYDEAAYPRYDNYDAIDVGKVDEIPVDYFDTMGVPVTFLGKYCPEQFEIVGITKTWFKGASKIYPVHVQHDKNGKTCEVTKLNDGPSLLIDEPPKGKTYYSLNGNFYIQLYARILIKRKSQK